MRPARGAPFYSWNGGGQCRKKRPWQPGQFQCVPRGACLFIAGMEAGRAGRSVRGNRVSFNVSRERRAFL
ncbi:hypothetical protein NDU88_003306 [Pleurodeles waltl]|uniref:Uncharacterized protein n=1 Tax=Pleurodeles waltl TaxID=8319 RepID=A0AAV7LEX3_PLEWA|nr:hypothetical protein NDU88_003306 [Pleurodeles waltl]